MLWRAAGAAEGQKVPGWPPGRYGGAVPRVRSRLTRWAATWLPVGAVAGCLTAGTLAVTGVLGTADGAVGPSAPGSRASAAVSVAPRVTLRPLHYVFPVARCETSYANGHHDYPAADIFADRGCRFVAPVDGTVEEVTRHDRWDPQKNRGVTRGGRSVAIVGVDGVRYYGSHLEWVRPDLEPGDRVHAGDLLGRVGESGSAAGTGTHLHFGISWPTEHGHWWVRRGAVLPQPFLDAWRQGHDRSPVTAVRRAERREGRDVGCRSYC